MMQLGRVGCETAPGENAEWTFVVGRGFLAVVPVTTGTTVVAALHALALESAVDIESLIALIPTGGPDDVDSFAVIVPGWDPERQGSDLSRQDGLPVRAMVRGAIAVDVFSIGGSRRFTDRNIRPWLLAEFQAVTGVVIGSPLAGVEGASRLGSGRALTTGLATGDTLFWSVVAGAAEAQDTILRPRLIVDDTVRRDRAPGTAVFPVIPAPGPGDEEPEGGAQDPTFYGFRLADGAERTLDRVYRIGRKPRGRRTSAAEMLELLVVDSPTAAVSASHLEIRQDGDAVVLTDLGSTNGTMVHFAIGRSQRMRSGASLAVLPGTTIDIGDGNLIEILPAD